MASIEGSRAESRAPTIQIRSSTLLQPGGFAVSPYTLEPVVKIQSTELGFTGDGRGPDSSLPATQMPYPVTSSVLGTPAPSIHAAMPIPPPPPPPLPPPPSPTVRPSSDSGRDAFLASIHTGVTLKRVGKDDKKDASASQQDEAHIEAVRGGAPVYQETPHSHDVEAREHAQAVEETERRQEEESAAHTKTPLTAPQPKMKMPMNFEDELTAKLGKMRLQKQATDEAGSGLNENGLRPSASNETWRTVFTEQEEENRMPDRQFKQDLGDTLSRPPTGTIRSSECCGPREVTDESPAAICPGVETPAPDVFVSLSANIARPGWDFSNVPGDGSGGPSGDRM